MIMVNNCISSGRPLLAVLALATFGLLAPAVRAGQQQALPASIGLLAVDGTTVTTANIGGAEKWLLIYVRVGNHASEVLLGQIDEATFPGVTSNIVVVVGGISADRLKQTSDKFPGLSKASWYADPSLDFPAGMKITGAPVMFGMQDRNVRWDLSGALFDSAKLKSIINSWFNPPQANP